MIRKITIYGTVLSTFVLLGFMFPKEVKATEFVTYNVKAGDTLSEIAERFERPLDLIISNNPSIVDKDLIFPEQSIIIADYIDSKQERDVREQLVTEQKNAPETQENDEYTTNYRPVVGSEMDLLARLVYAETNGEPYAGKVAVARVVLNRVESDIFPDSIGAVIYDNGQFSPVTNGTIHNAPTGEDYKAVQEAIEIGGNPNGALYFYNPAISNSSFHASKPTKFIIGNHVFK